MYVVIRAGRNDAREGRPNRRADAVENHLPGPLLDPEELVELVDFGPDLPLGLSAMMTSWQCFAV